MIQGWFHQGSGLGNQLARLVATRVRAADLGVDWGMIYNPDGSGKDIRFKGKDFMYIGEWDKGSKKVLIKWDSTIAEPANETFNIWNEKCVRDEISGVDVRSYDP